ncbi:MAG: type II toxin-antitoxin system RelE/ParE family toxin [Candidatus Rokubacteria bacterium]|nr:type II toxin-antitoxin system RelE/ParE family toxin [Candidatus Rokubacteria bacterium]
MCREIFLAPEAVEDFEAVRAYDRAMLREAIETHLRHEPTKTSKRRIRRLRGIRRPQYRLRVGEIRVFYDVTDREVEILAIVPKKEAAAWLERYGQSDKTKGEDEEAE